MTLQKNSVGIVEMGSDYREINRLIGSEIFTCPVIMSNGDALMCDDEGLLHGPCKSGFLFTASDGTEWMIMGNGLIVGKEVNEQTLDVQYTVPQIYNMIRFLEEEECLEYQRDLGF